MCIRDRSDPFRTDLFIELDKMEQTSFPEMSKEQLYTAHHRQNIGYHMDDGSLEGSGSDTIPYDNITTRGELNTIYNQYFLNGESWRQGVFHYGVLLFQYEEVNGCAFGSNRFQVSANGMEEKAQIPWLTTATVYASALMHETGHTLGFWPIPGHNRRSVWPWQLLWWWNHAYKSCMNYGYMYATVDYSDGSRRIPDLDDWERMSLDYFENGW